MNEIMEALEQSELIIIHRHLRPDPDAYGSQLGFEILLTKEVSKQTNLCSRS